jgi:MFS family permease
MIFNHWFFARASDHYIVIFVGIGLLYGIGFSIMCFKVKEGKYPPPPVEIQADLVRSRFSAISTYFHDCFTKPYYFMVFASIILPSLAFIPINTFNLYFAQSVGMSNARFGDLKAFYFLLSLLQTVPLGWMVDKFHPLRVSIIALILHGAASYWGGLFIHGTTSFAIAYVATGTLSGTWFTATASMALMLMPKIKFAQYYSAMAAIQSMLTIGFSLGMGKLLDLTNHAYRFTYIFGGVFDTLGLIATIVVFRMFLKLGGTRGYVAP